MSTNLDVPAAPAPTRAPQVASDAHGARTAAGSWLSAALLRLAACVAALSLLGPLVTGVIDYLERAARKAGRDVPLMALVPSTTMTSGRAADRS